MRKKLEAIFFDIDDTLFSTTEFARSARENSVDAMIKLGIDLPREKVLEELNEVIAEFSSNYSHHFDKLLARLPDESYNKVSPSLIIAAGIIAYHETKKRELFPYPDVTEVIRILFNRGAYMGVITAGAPVKQAEKLLRLRLDRYVNTGAVFVAEEVGFGKNNPKLYQKICQILGLDPAKTMYVGDNPPNDIDPPNAIGMITVLNRREGKYKDVQSQTEPNHIIQSFWDLLDLLDEQYEFIPAK